MQIEQDMEIGKWGWDEGDEGDNSSLLTPNLFPMPYAQFPIPYALYPYIANSCAVLLDDFYVQSRYFAKNEWRLQWLLPRRW